MYADWDMYMPLFYINSAWRTSDGIKAPITNYQPSGNTATRPKNLNEDNIGLRYFDTTIKKPIWWSGTDWIDSNGNIV